jgi:pyridinium-3,5-biscarboxylic acid mononucleotide synthase
MDVDKLRQLLEAFQAGQVSLPEMLDRLKKLPFDDLGYARLDVHRSLRRGLPEAVFSQNKTSPQVIGILQRLWDHHDRVLATRVSPDMADAIQKELPQATYDPTSRLLTLIRGNPPKPPESGQFALVVSAGTSDLPVAEEAAQTLEFHASPVERLYDVGVAGVHRLLDSRELIFKASVIISVAGMEGALTSLVGGLAACPVIGVPTSVGYGASFAGIAPLLTMLNSCAPGVAVVNIDNGYGAAVMAHLILRQAIRDREI